MWAKRKETSLICAFTREMCLGHSLVPRVSHHLVFDHLQCAKTIKNWTVGKPGNEATWDTVSPKGIGGGGGMSDPSSMMGGGGGAGGITGASGMSPGSGGAN